MSVRLSVCVSMLCIHCKSDVCQVGKLQFHCWCFAHIEILLYFAAMGHTGGLQNLQQDAAHICHFAHTASCHERTFRPTRNSPSRSTNELGMPQCDLYC